jgi:hypothetical protein
MLQDIKPTDFSTVPAVWIGLRERRIVIIVFS